MKFYKLDIKFFTVKGGKEKETGGIELVLSDDVTMDILYSMLGDILLAHSADRIAISGISHYKTIKE